MSRVRVSCFGLSLDGFGAGVDQSVEHPLGLGGEHLHEWMYPTLTFQQRVLGNDDGSTGPDNDFTAAGFRNIGAWILGRNMFGPVRGEWPDENWKGWWGDNPPYHTDVYVLTHYRRAPLEMNGGTIFHFVTDGIHTALERARASAGEKDVRIGGGVSTIRQYLEAGLVDEMHFTVSPRLLGKGEHLLSGIDLPALGYDQVKQVATQKTTHYVISKSSV